MKIMSQILEQVIPMQFQEYDNLDTKPFNFADYKECVLFFFLRTAYMNNMESASLRTYLRRQNAEDDERVRMERIMRYAQHYMNIHYEFLMNEFEIKEERLLSADMSKMKNKLSGYKITPLQFAELVIMSNLPLLKAITSKRICSAKKISNEKFIYLMEEYDNFIDGLQKKINEDEDMIFNSILAFDLESVYMVDFLYSVSCEAEKHNFPEPPLERLFCLCGEVNLPMPEHFSKVLGVQSAVVKSNFVKHRIDWIPSIFSYEWKYTYEKIYLFLWFRFCYVRMGMLDDMRALDFFEENTTLCEKADFLYSNYNLLQNRVRKEWNSKRIRYVRKLYSLLYTDMELPQIR